MLRIILLLALSVQITFHSNAQAISWDTEEKHEFFKCTYCSLTFEEITPSKIYNVSNRSHINDIIVSATCDVYPNHINKIAFINESCSHLSNMSGKHVLSAYKEFLSTKTQQKCNIGDGDKLIDGIASKLSDIEIEWFKECATKVGIAIAAGKE